MRRALVVAFVAILAVPANALAAEATSAEVRSLAVSRDAAALERLRSIDLVDGKPVDLRRALGTRDPAELRSRLDVLAEGPATGGADADARADAREVLDQRKYKRSSVPQPLRAPFERLGEWLEDVYDWLVERMPGGDIGVWTLVAALMLLFAGILSSRAVRRRVEEERASATVARRAGEDPRTLEREADAAERRGDHTTAIRLRFRAGLLRLDAGGTIELRPGLTTGAIARALRSPAFDAVAETFEEVVYGGRPATKADAAAAKSGWKTVLAETRRERPRELAEAA
jgi:hypothetical protein